MFKKAASEAAASERPRHTYEYVEASSDARTTAAGFFNTLSRRNL
jgi:hypothetical protein